MSYILYYIEINFSCFVAKSLSGYKRKISIWRISPDNSPWPWNACITFTTILIGQNPSKACLGSKVDYINNATFIVKLECVHIYKRGYRNDLLVCQDLRKWHDRMLELTSFDFWTLSPSISITLQASRLICILISDIGQGKVYMDTWCKRYNCMFVTR